MTKFNLESLLACPQCKTPIRHISPKGECKNCGFVYKNLHGIWDFLYTLDEKTLTSKKEYDSLYQKSFEGPTDGSYEILAAFARGNKTVDIACGVGLIEKLSPDAVGVDFSLNALKKAKVNGVKFLVHADAHALPFIDNAFDVAISNGNLEHFVDPQLAINEMARISRMQVMTVHQHPPIPFAHFFHHAATKIFKIKHQPIENPISQKKVIKMLENAGLCIVYKGVWTLPFNYGRVIKFLPEFKNVPSVSFTISIKK